MEIPLLVTAILGSEPEWDDDKIIRHAISTDLARQPVGVILRIQSLGRNWMEVRLVAKL